MGFSLRKERGISSENLDNRQRVVVLGGGGHAKVIIDMLQACGDVQLEGYVAPDDDTGPLCGAPWLGKDDRLPNLLERGVRSAFVAIGDNARRKERMGALRQMGYHLINAISQRATVSRHAILKTGISVMPGAIVNAGARLDDGVIINTNASVDHDCLIGEFSHIGPGSSLAGRVSIGEGAFLGTGTCVIPGISIGAWATVGAGSVVIRDLPGNTTAFGVPARLRNRKQVGLKHD